MFKNLVLPSLLTCGLAMPVAAQQVLGGATASVSLSIGIKGAERQPDIVFEVVQPSGDRSTATAKAPYNGERPGTATYPGDFTNAGMHAGTYKWTARDGGKIIGSGTFKYVPTKGGFQTFTPF